MSYQFKKVDYEDLNSRQQENYNFQKIAAHLADYGFNCIRLSDDWQGADFIACHRDGQSFLKVQLKSRLFIQKKYSGKDIYIAFINRNKDKTEDVYVYPHDIVQNELLARGEENGTLKESVSWKERGGYSWGYLSKGMRTFMTKYKV
ncbi:hypothetical protein [Roseateles sp. PN1]|uniref:hypothetical protein n=1 Tax=Roseateles sp. PN1 TaxID=3137372 RepID=UPI003139F158